mmetsp:Transcript_3590/g.8881  ORF Transcript_3590/g.8881 Transcript_3590/m.8881 type:complete len:209 (+) Transcript_3590:124-750(+)
MKGRKRKSEVREGSVRGAAVDSCPLTSAPLFVAGVVAAAGWGGLGGHVQIPLRMRFWGCWSVVKLSFVRHAGMAGTPRADGTAARSCQSIQRSRAGHPHPGCVVARTSRMCPPSRACGRRGQIVAVVHVIANVGCCPAVGKGVHCTTVGGITMRCIAVCGNVVHRCGSCSSGGCGPESAVGRVLRGVGGSSRGVRARRTDDSIRYPLR